MSLTGAIIKNASKLMFRVAIPETTSKSSMYAYQKILTDFATDYIKHNHPGSKIVKNQLIRFQEIYTDRKYLQLTMPIFNHKKEDKIIEVDC